jgi:hypothetical protein
MHEKIWSFAYIYNVFVYRNLHVKYSLLSTSDGSFSMGVREYMKTKAKMALSPVRLSHGDVHGAPL